MTNKRIISVLLCLALLFALSGCRDKKEKQPEPAGSPEQSSASLPEKSTDKSPASSGEAAGSSESGDVSGNSEPASSGQERLPRCIGNWSYDYCDVDGNMFQCRLLLLRSGQAQLQILDDSYMALRVADGSWSTPDAEHLILQLIPSMKEGLAVPSSERKPFGGAYFASYGLYDSMTLTCQDGADPLVLNHEYEPVTFFNEDPSPDLPEGVPAEIIETWTYRNGDQSWGLTILEDGQAQFFVQNGIGELLGLSGGPWSYKDDILHLELTIDPNFYEGFPPLWEDLGGDYRCEFKHQGGQLILTDLGNKHSILPEQAGDTAAFESSAAMFQREEEEFVVTSAVRAYYEAKTGQPYPGFVEVAGRSENGLVSVQVYEDMDGHTATAAWYTVNMETLLGTDDMTGEEIDFSQWWGCG